MKRTGETNTTPRGSNIYYPRAAGSEVITKLRTHAKNSQPNPLTPPLHSFNMAWPCVVFHLAPIQVVCCRVRRKQRIRRLQGVGSCAVLPCGSVQFLLRPATGSSRVIEGILKNDNSTNSTRDLSPPPRAAEAASPTTPRRRGALGSRDPLARPSASRNDNRLVLIALRRAGELGASSPSSP